MYNNSYTNTHRGYRIMAITPVFQTGDGGSIPPTRSFTTKPRLFRRGFVVWVDLGIELLGVGVF